ncbi:MAG: hypothetical protein Fur0032_20900 [Terrimicrobiaceae bacterium]
MSFLQHRLVKLLLQGLRNPLAKGPHPTVSREEAERLVNDIALTVANKRRISAELDEQLLALKERYVPQIQECDEVIKANSQLVQIWADANPEEFTKRKSYVFPGGTVGYRTGTPKAKTLTGFTWARVLEKLLALPWGRAFIRVTEDVAKDELIAAHSQGRIADSELREAGFRITQEESFFIEPDLTSLETRIQ